MYLIQGMYPAPKVDAVSLFGGYWMGGVVHVPVSSHCEGSVRIAHYESPLPRCIVRCKVSAYLCLGLGQGLPYAVHGEPRLECIISARALFE